MGAPWRWFRRRWTGRFWNRLAGRVGLGTTLCFSFRRLGKGLRNCGRRRRACTAIAGRRFGGCWKFWDRGRKLNAEAQRSQRRGGDGSEEESEGRQKENCEKSCRQETRGQG